MQYLLYKLTKYYKFDEPTIYEQLLAASVLEYNDKCWYYNRFDIFRCGLLVVLQLHFY